MTHLEDRITRALTQSPTRPSPDLFDRVLDSIEADRLRRRHSLLVASAAAVLVTAVTAAVLLLTPRTNGNLAMPWWILEVAVTLVLIAMAVWLGPFIKRFGRAYAADVFHDNPLTGKSYIVLTDIVLLPDLRRLHPLQRALRAAARLEQRRLRPRHPRAAHVLGSADRRHPAHHRPPARAQHRAPCRCSAGSSRSTVGCPAEQRDPDPLPLPVSTGAARSALSSTHVARAAGSTCAR